MKSFWKEYKQIHAMKLSSSSKEKFPNTRWQSMMKEENYLKHVVWEKGNKSQMAFSKKKNEKKDRKIRKRIKNK